MLQNSPKNIEELKTFLAKIFALDEDSITAKSQFVKDLGFDDIDFVLLVLELENVCRDRFDENKVIKLKTVGDLMNLIKEKINEDSTK